MGSEREFSMSAHDLSTIRSFVHNRFPQATNLRDDQDIFALGFVNSLFAMELVMFVEKTFGFAVTSDELQIDSFRSIDAIVALVERQTAPV